MYRIPTDLDLSSIIGADLNLIGMGKYDVQFHFDTHTTICLQSEAFILADGQIISSWSETNNWSTIEFQRALNQSVLSYSIPNEHTIEIVLTGNLSLRLVDSSDQYESMQIYFKNNNLPTVII